MASAARADQRPLPRARRPPVLRELTRSRAAEIQRERLLAATVRILEEDGCAQLTVARLTARAGVARSAFYHLFASSEDCLVGVLERATEAITEGVAEHTAATLPWRDRLHATLAAILALVDREPAVARVWLIHSEQAGGRAREYRDAISARLAALIDEGREEASSELLWSPSTAEAAVGAVMQILSSRLRSEPPEPTLPLLGPLLGMIVLPYLGASAARDEEARPLPDAPGAVEPLLCAIGQAGSSPLAGVRMRLTHRTAEALQVTAAHPGASNRALAGHLGISEPQVSRLLARLERLGLTINLTDGSGKGPRNAWYLTNLGERLLGSPAASEITRDEPRQRDDSDPEHAELSPEERVAWDQLESAELALQETRKTLTRLTRKSRRSR